MNKYFYEIKLLLFFILSIIFVFFSSGVSAENEVKLLQAMSRSHDSFGMGTQEIRFLISVEDIALEKEVAIWKRDYDGVWRALPAHYYGDTNDGREIWKLKAVFKKGPGLFGYQGENSFNYMHDFEFVVRYTVGGATYWDNNDGSNYSLNKTTGVYLANGIDVISDAELNSQEQVVEGLVYLANLNAEKSVSVHYTFNDWVDTVTEEVEFGTCEPDTRIFSLCGENPSEYNAEWWTFNIPLDHHKDLKYVVSYTVNNETYWDNNFTQDYFIPREGLKNFPQVLLRGTHNHWGIQNFVFNGGNQWKVRADFEGDNPEFKIDIHGDWSVNYGDNDADGIADFYGDNIQLPSAGTYDIFFNDSNKAYSAMKIHWVNQAHENMYVRGTFNEWETQPMMHIGEDIWKTTVLFSADDEVLELKFDAAGDWSENYGDSNADGIVELDGNGIKFATPGSYDVYFNVGTGQYKLVSLN